MIKQGLVQKQTQKLSPIQITTIRMIATPTQELMQEVKDEWESNPVLEDEPAAERDNEETEEVREISIDELKAEEDIPSYRLNVNNRGRDEVPDYPRFSVQESFSESLMEQLGFKEMSDREREVAEFIIGSLDDDGYLRRDIDSLIDDLAFRMNIYSDADEILRLLKVIQEFEPAGVGARDLRECLLIQLRESQKTEDTQNAIRILDECFEEFTGRHYDKVMSRLGLSKDEMKASIKRILRLNPSPGGQMETDDMDKRQQIIPDFKLRMTENGLEMEMPRFPMPEIRIKRKYAELLEDARNSDDREKKEAATFVKQKIDSAKWYVEALRQRHTTLEKTMNAIIDFQREYFEDGDESHLKPMVLKDIAAATGYDISTISRVVSSKYIDTHFGILPLKHFFSEGLTSKSGEEVSSREIKQVIREMVDSEDKNNPLTDDRLVEILTSKGYNVARRTVAKYREQLGILKARLRKEF